MAGYFVKVLLIGMGLVLRTKDMIEGRFQKLFKTGIYRVRRSRFTLIRRAHQHENIDASGMIENDA